ncbi:SDR family oxidoreductase [Roseomonas sp. GC11]|uniref:SDR family NAD(P)-dependent oxidoreductase n=1 Tax=Roseomonas sp. GC11 TaxID=2950546 RepID=UPI00210B2A0C|nr:SDR family NAD(P)-dependent oxidoreductase [Roseomonas sp. GC11]MCQ4159908.1 SDR family oxidoreductase [Roseomonas sp. GC11]
MPETEDFVEQRRPALEGRLGGRKIVVTGAGSGIGHRIAVFFAEEGASLLLLDQDQSALQQTARMTGGMAFAVDITDEEAVTQAIDKGAASLSGLDGVVNAAGIMRKAVIEEAPAALWRRVIDVNLTGTYIVTRACVPWMRKATSATVVNIASAQGLLPNAAGFTAYAASKGGVVNLTRALAAELAPSIRVNSVAPGMVDTPMADGYRGNTGNYALKRLADPLEIARVVLFLTSSEASYVTGSTLAADGGRSFH